MNANKIIEKLSKQYPGKKIIQIHEKDTWEIICETELGFAIAVIDKSQPHYHKKLTERYEILEGELTIVKDDKKYVLKKGDEFIIEPGTIHQAIGNETWVKVYSNPEWTQEDHILI